MNILPKILKLQKYEVKQIIAIIYTIAANEDEADEEMEIEVRILVFGHFNLLVIFFLFIGTSF